MSINAFSTTIQINVARVHVTLRICYPTVCIVSYRWFIGIDGLANQSFFMLIVPLHFLGFLPESSEENLIEAFLQRLDRSATQTKQTYE